MSTTTNRAVAMNFASSGNNPSIVFEVFVHKVDSLSDDQRIECQREVQNQLNDELATARVAGAKEAHTRHRLAFHPSV